MLLVALCVNLYNAGVITRGRKIGSSFVRKLRLKLIREIGPSTITRTCFTTTGSTGNTCTIISTTFRQARRCSRSELSRDRFYKALFRPKTLGNNFLYSIFLQSST
jgi:hypothetical protein